MLDSNKGLIEYKLGEFGEFNKVAVENSVNVILDKYKESGKDEIIFVNIGTDRIIGDIFAPTLGSYMEERKSKLKFYGTLENPIHAKNIDTKMNEIYEKHPDSFIIGVDSSIGKEVYQFKIRDCPLRPGSGFDKSLINVGDISMVFSVAEDSDLFLFKSIRFGIVYNAVKETYKILELLEKKIYS